MALSGLCKYSWRNMTSRRQKLQKIYKNEYRCIWGKCKRTSNDLFENIYYVNEMKFVIVYEALYKAKIAGFVNKNLNRNESACRFSRLLIACQWDSQGKSTRKLNSSANEKYEDRHLGCWYIKLTFLKRF